MATQTGPSFGALTPAHLEEVFATLLRVAELPNGAYDKAAGTALVIPELTTSKNVMLMHTVFTGDDDFVHMYTVCAEYQHATLREVATLGRLAMRGVAPGPRRTKSEIREDGFPRLIFNFELSHAEQRELDGGRPRTADVDDLLEAARDEWAAVDAILAPHGR